MVVPGGLGGLRKAGPLQADGVRVSGPDRKALVLTDQSCEQGRHCLSTGYEATFVKNIMLPSSFRLHGVRVETVGSSVWSVDSLQVRVDGQKGRFTGPAAVAKTRPLFFSVGCVTQASELSSVPAGTPCLWPCLGASTAQKYCYVDEEKKKWGYCAPACETKSTEDSQMKSELTCAELNWPTRSSANDDGAVCAASDEAPLKGCSGEVPWSTAQRNCKEVGARLCTRSELEADEAAGTGCGMDRTRVWSGTKCGTNEFLSLVGATAFRGQLKPRCTVADEPLARVRCCADARALRLRFRRSDRDAHALPAGLSIENSGGLMNWAVVSGTNWRGDFGFFLQSGMRGLLAPKDGQHLDVLLSGVHTAPRGGIIEFFYRIDSERQADLLRFFIDEMEQNTGGLPASGTVAWTKASFSFSGSKMKTHTFRWRYEKDGSESLGKDVACIDDIVVHGIRGLEP
ncbi:unnamed protein product [Effrenium voratum]|uniref:Uncharacterized protein n=1 Tax=Effrenium voratum TaxID=2562239 RepID=A0AA36MZ31_9DINO|nr:unnamed protein product [Effrenium voratum]CAJ1459535.1 unnamed protein product [Effrenium voratum]